MTEALFEMAAQGEEEREAISQKLVAFGVDRVRELEARPSRRYIGVLAKEVRELVDEGIPEDAIELGLALMAEQGERPSDLPFLIVKATRRRARAEMSAFVTEFGWPTGARFVRGSHSGHCVYDPLGTDRTPEGWPYPRPTREEVEPLVNALAAVGKFFETSVRA